MTAAENVLSTQALEISGRSEQPVLLPAQPVVALDRLVEKGHRCAFKGPTPPS
jgi:hypothetical protein